MSVCSQKPRTGPLLVATVIDTVIGGLVHEINSAGARCLHVPFPLVSMTLFGKIRGASYSWYQLNKTEHLRKPTSGGIDLSSILEGAGAMCLGLLRACDTV